MAQFPRFYQLLIILMLISFDLAKASTDNYVRGHIIVQASNEAELKKILSASASNGLHINLIKPLSKSTGIWLLSCDPAADHRSLVRSLLRMPEVLNAQVDHYVSERVLAPNDPYYSNQWGFNNTGVNGNVADADIDAPEAWNISTGGLTAAGDTIVVAVIDGGFFLAHPDISFFKNRKEIAGNSVDDDNNGYIDDYDGWNAYNSSGNITSNNHGTHVAGTVGAKGNNSLGVTGVNWNVKIMAIAGSTTTESVALEAYGYALEMRKLYDQTGGTKGAFVVATNASFGVDNGDTADFPLWCAMYDSLGKYGVLSAGATANANTNIDVVGDIPTGCSSDFLISVTNTTSSDIKYGNAAYGATTIDLGAPGTSIWSTTVVGFSPPNPSYGPLTGTSMATPHVAGTVALMYAAACNAFLTAYKSNPDSMALVIKRHILDGTDSIASLQGITVTGGRLNLHNALKGVTQSTVCLTSSAREQSVPAVKLFPNPVQSTITISGAFISTYRIMDSRGSLVLTGNGNTVEASTLPSGLYFLNVVTDRDQQTVVKFVKE